MFPEEWIEEVRNSNDIVDVVSGYVRLKKSGRGFMGLCPFHNEKTPSFSVNPEKQFYYCFGCHSGGNVIHFIMNIEKKTFVESVKYLAERANIPLPETDDENYRKQLQEKEKIYNINKAAAYYFYQNLISSKNRYALDYFLNRGITPETVKKFGLGFALNEWDDLVYYLKKKGISEEDMVNAGLAASKNGKVYDRFRNRVMIPIFNLENKVIGFGGRVLDKSEPKYLNSPETLVFNKSYNLFGLNIAKKNMDTNSLLVVEGYMDVISLHQYGITNAVASLGTALTQAQARLIKRYAYEVFLSYDGDSAGQNATARGMDILEHEGCKTKIVTVPGGKDPDEYIREYGKDSFIKLLNYALMVDDYKLELLEKKYDISTEEGKTQYTIEGCNLISKIENPIERENYIRKMQSKTGYMYNILLEQVEKDVNTKKDHTSKNINGNYRYTKNKIGNIIFQNRKAETGLIQFMINRPEKIDEIFSKLNIDDFVDPINKSVSKYVYDEYESGKVIDMNKILDHFQKSDEGSKITEIFTEQSEYDNNDKFMDDCIGKIVRNKIEIDIKKLQQEFNSKDIDKERRYNIMMKIQELNEKYQKLKKETK